MENDKGSLSAAKYYQQTAWDYFSAKSELEESKKKVDALKDSFEETMIECCDRNNRKSMTFKQIGSESKQGWYEALRVTKVEKTTIEWFVDKLKKRLPANLIKKVVRKQYTINNMVGLIEYLKSCGVDPNVFKKYLTVTEEVDEAAINRLSDLGDISSKQVSGCYLVKCSKPYFKLTKLIGGAKDSDDDGDE